MNGDDASPMPFLQFLREQTDLGKFIGKLVEKTKTGNGLSLQEQQLILTITNAIQGNVVREEFQARLHRMTSLGTHFTQMICLSAFNHPTIADLLEKTISTGNRTRGWVLSADIRKSTELMHQAKDAAQFARFLTNVSESMKMSVTYPGGYFDKFTGDGCLAFFPDTLCEGQSGLFALDAAVCCHNDFRNALSQHQSAFTAVPQETGLGVGLEYGEVEFVEIAYAKTIVGEPVVRACRLSSCPADRTYLAPRGAEGIVKQYPQLQSRFSAETHKLKSYGDEPVSWWKGDLTEFPEIDLHAPSWLQQLSAETKLIQKTPIKTSSHIIREI